MRTKSETTDSTLRDAILVTPIGEIVAVASDRGIT